MAIKIEGKGRVWSKEHDGWTSYTIGISNKNQDGTWINAYQQVRFRKNVKVPNGTDIEFVAFPTVKKGDPYNTVLWQITEYRNVGNEMAAPSPEESYTALTNDDIPF